MAPHDLRRTWSTFLQGLKVDLNVIDRCQNHVWEGPKPVAAISIMSMWMKCAKPGLPLAATWKSVLDAFLAR